MISSTDQLQIVGEKVLLVGVRGMKNLGDELILLGNIKLLKKQHKKIFIVTQNPVRLREFLSQEVDCSDIVFLQEIPRGIRSRWNYLKTGTFRQLKYFFHIDTIILGGGEILTEESKNSYTYRLPSLWPSLIFRKKLYIMGGVQIPKKKINIFFFNRIVKHTEKIYCRDFEGEKILKSYGKVPVSFFMDTSYFVRENWLKYHSIPKKKYIVVNVNRNGSKFLPQIKEEMKKYLTKGYECYFIPVAAGGNDTNDSELLRKRNIPAYLAHTENDLYYLPELQKEYPHIKILEWEQNFEAFLEKVAGAEMVISPRLHLYLISTYLGVKTLPFPYQKKINKMKQVMQKYFS